MYKAEIIKEELFGATPLIGWRQNDDPEVVDLDEELTTSRSGRYYQDSHPMLTLSNVFSIAPRFADYTYKTWLDTLDYSVGQIVAENGLNWVCVQAYTVADDGAQTPSEVDSLYWQEWTASNAKSKWLKQKTQGYILSVIDDLIDTKKWARTAKSIIEERALFDGAQYGGEVTAKTGKVAGFELRVNRHTSVLAKINLIGLQFTEIGNVTLTLWHSGKTTPVDTKVFEITEAGSMQLFQVDWELPYISSFDVGGTWRVEYVQNDVNGNSINKAKDWSDFPMTRQGYNYNSWKLWSPYIDIHPYLVGEADRKNPAKRLYQYTDNFGMNLIVSMHCDYTGLFVRQASAFQNALIKGVGLKFLREIALNPNARINQRESGSNLSKDELLYEIDGNTQGRSTGLGAEYMMALNGSIIDTEGLDALCLPCTQKRLKMRTT